MKSDMIIWDIPVEPPISKNLCLWRERSWEFFSILNYIDKNSKLLKKEFINYFDNLKNKKIKSETIQEYYNFYPGFSYWQLSCFQEKSFYKENSIINILKIIALNKILIKKKINNITIVSNDNNLILIIKKIAQDKKIKLTIRKKSSFHLKFSFHIFLYSFFKSIGIFIKFIIDRLFPYKNKNNLNLKSKNIFFSYGEKLNLKKNLIISKYWDDIFNFDKSAIFKLFVPNNQNKNLKSAQKSNSQNIKSNLDLFFLDEFFDSKVFSKVLKSIFFIYYKNTKFILTKNKIFYYKNIDFWPIVKKSWIQSFCLYDLFFNLYFFYLIEKIVSNLENNRKCFFLLENQPWERALCFFWKKNFKKNIIGVVHAPIRFWDLRFFNIMKKKSLNYRPNVIALNGNHSYNLFNKEYLGQKKILLDSLRYKKINFKSNPSKKNKTILIVGEYLDEINVKMIRSIENSKILKSYKFIFLKHPSNEKYYSSNYLKFKFLSKKDLIYKYNFDYCIIPHNSSAIIDFKLIGKKIVIFLYNQMPNLSPLFPKIIDNCAYDSKSLDVIFSKKISDKFNKKLKFSEIFYSTKDKKKWKKILSNIK